MKEPEFIKATYCIQFTFTMIGLGYYTEDINISSDLITRLHVFIFGFFIITKQNHYKNSQYNSLCLVCDKPLPNDNIYGKCTQCYFDENEITVTEDEGIKDNEILHYKPEKK